MKASIRTACATPSLIALPNFKLDPARNESIVFQRRWGRCQGGLIIRRRNSKLEFENPSLPRGFHPPINQLKCAVVDPYSGPNFLEYSNLFRRLAPALVALNTFGEEPILRKWPARIVCRLIDTLRVWYIFGLCAVMTLVYQGPSLILDPVCVGSSNSDAHEEYAIGITQAKIHSPLQIDTDG